MTNNKKIILSFLTGVAVLLVGGDAFYYCKVQNLKQQIAQEVAEKQKNQQETELKTDSIYHSFISVDLNMADVKGFVHTIDYVECNDELYPTRNVLLTFDKKGNIVDVKAQYRYGKELYTATFERNKNSQIASIAVRTSYTTVVGDSYKGYVVRDLTYDDEGHIKRMVLRDESEGGKAGEFVSDEINFSDYQKGKGCTIYTSSNDDGFATNNETVHFSETQNDEMGNWITRSGELSRSRSLHVDEEGYTETKPITESRKITYYKKDEIDFTKLLK